MRVASSDQRTRLIVKNIPDLPGIRIKARGTNNSDYRALEAKLVREIPRAERIEGVSPKEQDRIAGQLLSQTVVLDVEGLEDDDNKPLAYTRELGAQLLLDPGRCGLCRLDRRAAPQGR